MVKIAPLAIVVLPKLLVLSGKIIGNSIASIEYNYCQNTSDCNDVHNFSRFVSGVIGGSIGVVSGKLVLECFNYKSNHYYIEEAVNIGVIGLFGMLGVVSTHVD